MDVWTRLDTLLTPLIPHPSPPPQVQAQAQNGKQYSDATNNRTLLSNGQSAIINLYHPINKQMSAVPSTSGKGWTCSEYCPLDDGAFPDPLALGKGTKDIGTATVNGKTVEQYQWFDRLIIIKMDENDLYVDQSGASPVPVLSVQKITPFGGAEIAEESSTYGGFISGASDPSTFAVDNLATCEMSDQCNQNAKTHSMARRGAALLTARTQRTLAELAQEFVDKEEKEGKAAAIAVDAPATNSKVAAITWPKDWIAGEASSMLINQGGQVRRGGEGEERGRREKRGAEHHVYSAAGVLLRMLLRVLSRVLQRMDQPSH